MKKQEKSVQILLEHLKKQGGHMVNERVVLDSIEAYGVRQIDVKKDYGFETIEALADYIYFQIQAENLNAEVKNANQIKDEKERILKIRRLRNKTQNQLLLLRADVIAVLHALPILIQVAAIVVSGLALWAYTQFSGVQATSVMLGVILGFVASAGFIQVLGRQVSFFWYREDWYLARLTIVHVIRTYFKLMFFL